MYNVSYWKSKICEVTNLQKKHALPKFGSVQCYKSCNIAEHIAWQVAASSIC